MDKKVKYIVALQFIHIIIFSYAFSFILRIVLQKTSGMELLYLWQTMIPIFIFELLLLIILKAKIRDILLPIVSVFILFIPMIFQGIRSSITFEEAIYSIIVGATFVTIFNFYLLLTNFKIANLKTSR